MTARFAYVPMASEFLDDETMSSLISDYVDPLQEVGATRWVGTEPDADVPLGVFVVSGGTEQMILDLWSRRRQQRQGEPLLLLAHPGHNSLPASLEALARLQQLGAAGRIVFLNGADDKEAMVMLEQAIADIEVWEGLHKVRIGSVGPPSDWLVASSPAAETVRATWGPEVVDVDLESVYELFRNAADWQPIAVGLTREADRVVEADTPAVDDAAKFTAALREIVAAENLDAVTVRCFDVISALGTTGCVALSDLNDDHIIAGCEGDLVSTVGMIWADRLLGTLPWMANPARVDVDANRVLLAHCTVPRSLIDSFSVRSHFESGQGVGIEGHFPLGPVTLVRIGGLEMEKLWLAEGQIVRTGNDPTLCRTQIEVELDDGSVADLLDSPLGNHLIVVPGRHRMRLAKWHSTMVLGRHGSSQPIGA